jgi:hypothetical protein
MSESTDEHLLERAVAYLQQRLRGRVRDMRVLLREGGVILQGQALNYHAKQLGQHIAMNELRLTVVANELEVRPPLPGRMTNADATEQ